MIIIIAQMITISHFKVSVTESLSFVRRQNRKLFPFSFSSTNFHFALKPNPALNENFKLFNAFHKFPESAKCETQSDIKFTPQKAPP